MPLEQIYINFVNSEISKAVQVVGFASCFIYVHGFSDFLEEEQGSLNYNTMTNLHLLFYYRKRWRFYSYIKWIHMDIYVGVVVQRYRAIFFDKALYKRIDFK